MKPTNNKSFDVPQEDNNAIVGTSNRHHRSRDDCCTHAYSAHAVFPVDHGKDGETNRRTGERARQNQTRGRPRSIQRGAPTARDASAAVNDREAHPLAGPLSGRRRREQLRPPQEVSPTRPPAAHPRGVQGPARRSLQAQGKPVVHVLEGRGQEGAAQPELVRERPQLPRRPRRPRTLGLQPRVVGRLDRHPEEEAADHPKPRLVRVGPRPHGVDRAGRRRGGDAPAAGVGGSRGGRKQKRGVGQHPTPRVLREFPEGESWIVLFDLKEVLE
mmetsp:Transcript_21859/g.49505  ORF Transcript_21859/g.49505 Transcript_21859/m.49505 type:complete len:272 (+) Transcript_21859:426-1241(+)